MKLDIARHFGAVSRVVTNREIDGKPAAVVVATRNYDTTIDDAWEALTSAERIPRWFLPITGDLKLGGRYQLQGNAGGTITACEPPHRLCVTWEFGGDVSWVTITLTEHGAQTRLELEHAAHVKPEFWNQFGPGAVGVGWDGALMGLAEYLASSVAIDRKEADAWQASDEGKAFYRICGEAWGRADIANGTDETEAKARAARTTAFYCGESPPA
jgi:uncharacterized protein YndB with AHSA1/START domain